MGTYYSQVNLNLPISEVFRTKCIEWCDTLYTSAWEGTPRHTDQFVDTNLSADTSGTKKIVLTRFGDLSTDFDSLQNSFWCITGNSLYDYMPWYKPMEDFLSAQAGLTSQLSFPCLLACNGKVRKHPDAGGRKTVLNFNIFGSEKIVWGIDGDANPATYDVDVETTNFTETYSYTDNQSMIVNTSAVHGGNKIDGHTSYKRVAINHGFLEDFETVRNAFTTMAANGKLIELQTIIDSNT